MRPRLAGAALLLVAWAASAAATTCPHDPDILLQTTDGADGQARIAVGIGGVPRNFIFDTGAPLSVLRESVVDELGLQHVPIPLDAISGATGRPFQEGAIVPLVELGSAQRKDVGFLIEPRSHAENDKQAGLIGANLFGADDLELDFAHHRIALRAPGSCRPDTMPGLPLTVTPSRHVLVRVLLDGQGVKALIDTGAAQSILLVEAAHRLYGIDPSLLPHAGEIIGADGGRIAAYARPFGTLAMGSIVLNNPPVVIVPDQTHRMRRPLSGTAGLDEDAGLPDLVLGMPILRRLHLIIAYRDATLYVAQAETP